MKWSKVLIGDMIAVFFNRNSFQFCSFLKPGGRIIKAPETG